MTFATLAAYDAGMQQSTAEENTPRTLVDMPTVCPVCWNHDITRVEQVRLFTHQKSGQHVGRASVYRCAHWHLFALFDQP
jgi:hypothetical protein